MQYINILGAHRDCVSLRSFAKLLFEALGISDMEEHESSNYVDGCYLKGTRHGMLFTVASSDESAYEDLPYWIHVSADVHDFETVMSMLIRSKVLPAGFRLAHIIDFGKRGEQRVDY